MHRKNHTPTVDRRVMRTRASLQHAFIDLVPERGFAALTVDEICARANIGRSTFYTHYKDKEALRQATMEDHLQIIGRTHKSERGGDTAFAFSLPIFEHAFAFGPLHRALIADRRDPIHDQLHGEVRKAVRTELAGRTPDGIPEELGVEFLTGAFLALLGWWIESGYPLPPTEVDSHFQKLAATGLRVAGST